MHSYFLLGSHAEGSAVPLLSDIDFMVVFKGALAGAQAEAAQQVAQVCAARSPARLDLVLKGEAELGALHSVLQRPLKSGSRLLHGDDLRAALPEIALEPYRWAVWDGALQFVLRILRGVERIDLPLSWPDPQGEFFSYDCIRVAEWYPPEFEPGTKELVAAVSRLCSALLADQAGVQVAGKTEAFRRYPELIGDHWSPLIGAIFDECKLRWHYRVPAGRDERRRLRFLCERILAFENHGLAQCRRYFQHQRAVGDAAHQAEAEARLRRLAASNV